MGIAETVRGRVRAALVRASASSSLERMLDDIDTLGVECSAAFAETLAQAAAADRIRGTEIARVACRRGCAFCCHVDVDVTPLEAIRLARRAGRFIAIAAQAPARRA